MGAPSVMEDLVVWGPQAVNPPPPSLIEAQGYCRRLAQSHYENFPVVSWLLPRRLHQHFHNVYAFCRWADDLGDEAGSPARACELLAWWQQNLNACYAGDAVHPVFVALRETVREFSIPQQPFNDLISAFQQDQTVHRYDTFSELADYCRRSANPVGRIVLALVGRADHQNAAWSDSICTGLQLANFWQDVARDYNIGRVYLPREDRERFGYSEDMLLQKRSTPEFQNLLKFEVDRARELLLAGSPLIYKMPGRLKVDIDLFQRGGLMILKAIERFDYRVWEQRPVLRKWQFALATMTRLPLLLLP